MFTKILLNEGLFFTEGHLFTREKQNNDKQKQLKSSQPMVILGIIVMKKINKRK